MKSRNLKFTILLCLVGCSTPEVLVSRDGTVPPGVDLSGNWNIRTDLRANQAEVRDAIRLTDGIKDDQLFRRQSRQSTNPGQRGRSGSVKGGLVYVFLELGESLKLTQTTDGLFISFDRSVVEEYRFGENRMVSIGEVQAQRVTGWDGDTLVIETLDRNRMKLTEKFRLQDNGATLERTIIFRSKAQDEAVVVQTFDRAVR